MENDDLTKKIMDFAAVTADENDQLKSSYSQESCGPEEDIVAAEAIVLYVNAARKNLTGFIDWYKNYKK